MSEMIEFPANGRTIAGYLARAAAADAPGVIVIQEWWGLVGHIKSVADRLAAPPGSKTYGVPSVKAAWFADVRRAGAIGRNVFWPAPNVDSGLVSLTRREPPETSATREQVFACVDAAFAQRRKTLRAALASWAGSAPAAEAALVAAGIDPRTRGEQLDVHQFAAIASAHAASAGSAASVAEQSE